jgi:hypothetical protein
MKPTRRIDLGRRALLSRVGSAALALPFLEATGPRRAWAQPLARRARNFLMITMPNGIDPATFWPTGGETDFVLPAVLQPLEKHRNELLIIGPQFPDATNRVPVANTGLTIKKHPGIHRAWAATTGENIQATRFPQTGDGLNVRTNAPSVDQLIASKLKAARAAGARSPAFDSLELGIHPVGGDVPTIVNFTMTGEPMPRMQSDVAAWERVFGGVVPGGAMGPDPRGPRRAAVSTYLQRRLRGLAPTLGQHDRQRLESHMQTLREVEMRIGMKTPTAPGCPVTATMPFTPATPDPAAPMMEVPALYANMQDMVALAFACDLTRVASISFSHEGGGRMVPAWLGIKNRDHHGLSHRITNPVEREKFNKVMGWAAGMVSRMLDRLKALPHPDGGTLHDHTLLWWMFRHGDGKAHASFGIPGIIAGGAGGHYRMGRYLSLPSTNYFSMVLSIVNAMGIDVPGFGLGENLATAPLSGLT